MAFSKLLKRFFRFGFCMNKFLYKNKKLEALYLGRCKDFQNISDVKIKLPEFDLLEVDRKIGSKKVFKIIKVG